MNIFPIAPVPNKITPRSTHQTYVSMSRSLRRQAASRGGHLWSFDLEYPAMTRNTFQPLWAFIVAQRGQYETFAFVPAVFGIGNGDVGTSAPVVNGTVQTGRSVVSNGWQAGATMKAGDFIRFSGHTKCYMLTADVVADAVGNATISIEPALFVSPADNEPLIITDVDFTCAFTEDVHELAASPGVFGEFPALKITEVVE